MTTNNMLKRLVENRLIKARVNQAQSKTVSKPVTSAIPVVDDPTLQTWIKSISREINQFARNGITRKDLIDYGVLGVGRNGDVHSLLTPQLEVDYTVPRAVKNLTANGAYSSITLTWETPQNKSFGYNAVYRSEVDDFGTANQIGSSIGDIYTDYVGNGIKAYYWVRTISKYNVEGDLSPSVYAETSINIPYLIEQLTNKITSSQLVESLKTEIERIQTISLDLQIEVSNRLKLAEDTALKFLNLTDSTNASITNLQTTLNSKIENVAQEVSLVSAGVGEQFDTHLIWFFDGETTEGWISTSGLPTVLNGWIKPHAGSAEADLISPQVTPFKGSMYPDIRFRVRKIGNPTWAGRIYWGENLATFLDISEPIWNPDSNIGTVQGNIDWIGDINQIRLLLSNNQDANNYYILDWFSFGRPSPAASWSAIGEVKTAVANETYARTEYERLNDTRFASNDAEYRSLISDAIQTAADQNGIVSNRVDSIVLSLKTQYAGSEEDMAGDETILVGHITEETYRIEGDAALGERIDLLAAQVNEDITASIQEESRVRASQDEALAEQINTMQAKIDDDITAAIQEEALVRATQNEALANKVDSLQAKVDVDIAAAIQTESTARTNADSALSQQITTLHSTFTSDIAAAIQSEATARTNADSALSQTVSTVQTTVNGHTASIQEHRSSIDGLNAEWKLKVQAGGRVSGVALGVNGQESSFVVMTDRFSVVSPNGSISVPFVIDTDGKTVINTAVIKDASIAGAKIGELSADKITSGNIAADRMRANILAATEGQFTSISAITGTIGVLRTATSGARTEIRDNLIEVYDANNRLRVRMGVW